uniref:PPM-type phosphatase domain-containing protein n=1 Tax=Plectus sambesii TaxID=2011161 RepID=A0A914UU18_9BILA
FVAGEADDGSSAPVVSLRPSLSQLAAHDAVYEAIELSTQFLLQRDFPLWLALAISQEFVAQTDTSLVPKDVEFSVENYRPITGATWYKAVVSALTEYCSKIAQEQIPLPHKAPGWDRYPYSLCAMKNSRRNMEDRHVVLPSLAAIDPSRQLDGGAFFAVFDGHLGAECANYAAAHVAFRLIAREEYSTAPEAALKAAMVDLDERLTVKCKKENIRSGATAVCALVKNSKLHLAWCGDSAIAVLRAGKVITLSTNHTPDDPSELSRIEAAGGMVMSVQGELRVQGILNISRSLGDILAKPVVSSDTDVSTTDLDGGEYLLILACDGVWDQLDECEVFAAIREFVETNDSTDYAKMADFVVRKAKEEGATDNMTLVVVFLRPVDDLWKLFS